jgi:hypothetical protein
MRCGFCIVAICIHALLFNTWIYEMAYTNLDIFKCKLLYNYTTAIMIAFFFVDLRLGLAGDMHKQWNLVCFMSVMINLTIVILINSKVLVNSTPVPIFILFNTLWSSISLIIYFFARHYGFTNNE